MSDELVRQVADVERQSFDQERAIAEGRDNVKFGVDETEVVLFVTPERVAALEQAGCRLDTVARMRAYLAALAEHGLVTYACRTANIALGSLQQWRNKWDVFAEMEKDARRHAGDRMEAAAIRRARDGVLKPVWQKGEFCGYERVYSDSLMIEMLRANDPDRFARRNKTELSGPNGAPIEIAPIVNTLRDRIRRLRRAEEEPEPTFDAGEATTGEREDDAEYIRRSKFHDDGAGADPNAPPPDED